MCGAVRIAGWLLLLLWNAFKEDKGKRRRHVCMSVLESALILSLHALYYARTRASQPSFLCSPGMAVYYDWLYGTIWERAPFREIWDASRGVQGISGGNGARYENDLNRGGPRVVIGVEAGTGPVTVGTV